MRQNNLQQWQICWDQIRERLSDFIKQNQIVIPPVIYYVWGGQIEVRVVEGYGCVYDRKWSRAEYPRNPKRPTNEEVELSRQMAATEDLFDVDKILLFWQAEAPSMTISGAERYGKLQTDCHLTTERDKAQELAQQQVKKKQEEDALEAQGYKRCAYCRALRPPNELGPGTIYAQQYPNGQTVRLYCFDKGCNDYDQMAHEG